jgi:hypothetical protein
MTDYRSNNVWGQQPSNFSPIDSSFQWDYAGVQSPKNMVSHYNNVCSTTTSPMPIFSNNPQLLQRAADFYATLDNSFDSMSSSGSDSSYRSTPERRISTTSGNVVAQVKNSIPDKIEVSLTNSTCSTLLTEHRGEENKIARLNEHTESEKKNIKRNSKSKSRNGNKSTNS